MRSKATPFLFLFAAVLSSCVSYKPYPSETQPPYCSIEKANESAAATTGVVVLHVSMKNPNPFPLEIERMSLVVSPDPGASSGVSLTISKKFTLSEFGARDFRFNVLAKEWAPLSKRAKRGRLVYYLSGEASIRTREGARLFYLNAKGKTKVAPPAKPMEKDGAADGGGKKSGNVRSEGGAP